MPAEYCVPPAAPADFMSLWLNLSQACGDLLLDCYLIPFS